MPSVLQPNAILEVDDWKAWANPRLQMVADDEDLVIDFINSVSDDIESICRRKFLTATIVDERTSGNDSRVIRVQRPPITTVSAVKRVFGTTVLETYDPATYFAPNEHRDDNRIIGQHRFHAGIGNILVSYTGGFDAYPPRIVQAAREMVAIFYLSRGKDARVQEETSQAGTSRRRVRRFGWPTSIMTVLADYILALGVSAAPVSAPTWGGWI